MFDTSKLPQLDLEAGFAAGGADDAITSVGGVVIGIVTGIIAGLSLESE